MSTRWAPNKGEIEGVPTWACTAGSGSVCPGIGEAGKRSNTFSQTRQMKQKSVAVSWRNCSSGECSRIWYMVHHCKSTCKQWARIQRILAYISTPSTAAPLSKQSGATRKVNSWFSFRHPCRGLGAQRPSDMGRCAPLELDLWLHQKSMSPTPRNLRAASKSASSFCPSLRPLCRSAWRRRACGAGATGRSCTNGHSIHWSLPLIGRTHHHGGVEKPKTRFFNAVEMPH